MVRVDPPGAPRSYGNASIIDFAAAASGSSGASSMNFCMFCLAAALSPVFTSQRPRRKEGDTVYLNRDVGEGLWHAVAIVRRFFGRRRYSTKQVRCYEGRRWEPGFPVGLLQ